MTGYGLFAEVYDRLTVNVPYDEIAEYYCGKIRRFSDADAVQQSVCSNFLADAGCGTGNLTAKMAEKGFDVIGADASPDMLSIAMNKPHDGVQYICQSMTELELYGEADVVISTLDSVNHLGSADEISAFFRAAAVNLRKGGLLLFDVNTPYKHEKILADNTFVYDVDGVYCVWQNEYSPEDKSVEICLDIFVEEEDGRYSRFEESFAEIAPTEGELRRMLEEAGFDVLEVCEYLTDKTPADDSDKLMFTAKKR